jgi:Na+/H+ antiporter NhaD/arsenite permease-like protein
MIIILVIFILGYLAITLEHSIRVNKAAIALVTGVLCWTVYILINGERELVNEQLAGHLGELSQILFFLLGAMTIVELIDAHDGFDVITSRIHTLSKTRISWIVGFLAFFLSAVLDNLTTTIVLVSMIRKLVDDKKDRWMLAGIIIIAANAGGAWSPIGDVTTTMLWIGNQITALNIIIKLIIPSLVCLMVPLMLVNLTFKGNFTKPTQVGESSSTPPGDRLLVFVLGTVLLLMVPIFKTLTHLPPFMGIMIALGLMWIITEIMHSDKDEAERKIYSVAHAIRKIDTPSILFFLGILLAISALEATGQLRLAADWMNDTIKDQSMIAVSIGLLSAVVDNVPLVAATQGMYSLQDYPTDHYFWEFLAYTTGTGGSILIIGSAAGVAAMGIEKIPFGWYLRKIGWLALAGFIAGALTYIMLEVGF